MKEPSDIERFQRWLQAELSEASAIEDKEEREKRQIQIEIAISEAIKFRQLIDTVKIASPFIQRDSNVREPSSSEVKPTVKSGECHSCGAIRNSDIEFCPVCGEF